MAERELGWFFWTWKTGFYSYLSLSLSLFFFIIFSCLTYIIFIMIVVLHSTIQDLELKVTRLWPTGLILVLSLLESFHLKYYFFFVFHTQPFVFSFIALDLNTNLVVIFSCHFLLLYVTFFDLNLISQLSENNITEACYVFESTDPYKC